jgi:hypothetical protein
MFRTITILGLAGLLIAGCAAGPVETADRTNREEAYTPIGSNVPRRGGQPRAVDVPIGGGQIDTVRGPGAATK